jgi:hypothetical protein
MPDEHASRTLVAAFAGAILAAAVLAACAGPAATSPTLTVTPSAAPTCPVINNGPEVPTRTVLYRDPLLDGCGNWERNELGAPTRQGPPTHQAYEQGGYRILLGGTAPTDVWTGPDSMFGYRSLADYRVEVDAQRLGGPDKNLFGVICRLASQGTRILGGYAFYIGSDGRYVIQRKKDVQSESLAEGLDPSAIDGNGVNHIRVDCLGPTLALYANGKKLVEVQDTTYPQGFAGLAVRSIDTSGVDIVFKNFVMTRL